MDIEKALRQYQRTKDFSDDCQRKKTELFADFHVLPGTLLPAARGRYREKVLPSPGREATLI